MGEIENSFSLELRRHLNFVDEHFDSFVKKKYDFSGLIKMACNLVWLMWDLLSRKETFFATFDLVAIFMNVVKLFFEIHWCTHMVISYVFKAIGWIFELKKKKPFINGIKITSTCDNFVRYIFSQTGNVHFVRSLCLC